MPRTGRPRGFDKDAAIEKAMLLLWRRGFAATTLADLKEAMGIASPTSFYAAFSSRDALLLAALNRYLATHGRVMAPLHDPALAPREAIERALRGTARMQTDPGHPPGCLVALSAANGPAADSPAGRTLAGERARNSGGVAVRVAQAARRGEIGGDPSALAALVEAAMAGLSLRARDGATLDELDRAIDAVMAAWDASAAAQAVAAGSARPSAEAS